MIGRRGFIDRFGGASKIGSVLKRASIIAQAKKKGGIRTAENVIAAAEESRTAVLTREGWNGVPPADEPSDGSLRRAPSSAAPSEDLTREDLEKLRALLDERMGD